MLPSSQNAQSAHTLPRNFTFHYQDGQPPKTPEPLERDEQAKPVPPPPARDYGEPYRKKRTRPQIPTFQQRSYRAIHPSEGFASSSDSRDIPLPSIELLEAPTGFHHPGSSSSTNTDTGLHAMAALNARPMSPPTTPIAQMYGAEEVGDREENPAEDSSSQGDSLTRPSTACSAFSDSSNSSSVESFPSLTGFGTSLETESFKPFGFSALKTNPVSSPLHSYSRSTTLQTPMPQKPSWTDDMDNHLWITYMRYLQDATHTPFKMLPGTAPPIGVCSRVAREAKQTWRGSRSLAIPRAHQFARWGSTRVDTPEEVPTSDGATSPKPSHSWGRSDAATRKRLRELCKRKPTLSAHYNRLLHARSPTPLSSSMRSRTSSMARDLSPPGESNAFSTRDMNISLATSISSTMHFGAPLSRITSELSTPRPRATTQFQLPPSRSPGHQKSQSLHFGVGLAEHSAASSSGLASPFRPTSLFQMSRTQSENSLKAPVSALPTLASPVELHAPIPRRLLFKRPAQQELEDAKSEDPFTRQNHLMRELFGPPAAEPAHRRVRSRGFSLGDMSASSRLPNLGHVSASTRLSNLFAPPDTSEPMGDVTATQSSSTNVPATSSLLLPPPSMGRLGRLGSPFAEKKQHFNTFPRNFSLHGLEPAMEMNDSRGPADPDFQYHL
ncbi:hypothetical protein EJ08DRAFT_488167 [Tothia fuscella]|uniref:Uncharacterized protein n=1 Tax=Tothia fuscella TaxID=1048955 RepID=A0A9P4TUE7_9PEZI|nr:hypothetical protein EJ08DRAFT_488167 [Tothia fuscella]